MIPPIPSIIVALVINVATAGMGSYVDGNGSALMITCSDVTVDLALASALSSEHALNVNVESMAVEIAANIQVGLFLLYTLDFLVVLCCKVV